MRTESSYTDWVSYDVGERTAKSENAPGRETYSGLLRVCSMDQPRASTAGGRDYLFQ